MTTIEQECSRHNQSTSEKLNDQLGATIELDNSLSNSYGIHHPPVILAPTWGGNLCIIFRKGRYELGHEAIRNLLVYGQTANILYEGVRECSARCSQNPDGTEIYLHMDDFEYIIPRDQFEKVARAEVPGLIVRQDGVAEV